MTSSIKNPGCVLMEADIATCDICAVASQLELETFVVKMLTESLVCPEYHSPISNRPTMTLVCILDEQIARKKEKLRKLREDTTKNREAALIKMAEMETKKSQLQLKVQEVLEAGLDLSVFSQAMEKVYGDYPRKSIMFGHQVLLLSTVHLMEVHETLLKICCRQKHSLVKFGKRRKRALRAQNSEHVIRFVNRLSEQYELMKNLEDDYRHAIHAQQAVISRFEWKNAEFEMQVLPRPTLSATTSDFARDKKTAIFLNQTASSEENATSGALAASMRQLMEIDGAFPPPTEDDLLPTIRNNYDALVYDSDNDRPPVDVIMTLNSFDDISRHRPGRRLSRRSPRSKRSSSLDAVSITGEELLQGIQSYFFGIGKSTTSIETEEELSLGNSDPQLSILTI